MLVLAVGGQTTFAQTQVLETLIDSGPNAQQLRHR